MWAAEPVSDLFYSVLLETKWILGQSFGVCHADLSACPSDCRSRICALGPPLAFAAQLWDGALLSHQSPMDSQLRRLTYIVIKARGTRSGSGPRSLSLAVQTAC